MKTLGIDFGASFVDAVLFDGIKIISKRSIPRSRYISQFLEEFPAFDMLVSTGSKPHKNMKHTSELECIAKGGLYLTNLKSAVVVSCGTGTACVHISNNKISHLGGTGIGGGTLAGLAKLLLNIDKIEKLFDLAKHGKRTNIDLTVGDILGKGVGILSKDATAANFGKPALPAGRLANFNHEDISLGLIGLVSETIAVVASLAAKSVKEKNAVFVGRLASNQIIQKYIKQTARIFGIDGYFPQDGIYATALGAALSI